MDLKVGSIIEDKFEILERIGAGGMGTVYKAKDLTLLRICVLKILTPSFNSSKGFLRFQNEAKVLGKLQHPGIADIYNVGVTSDGLAYLALEYVGGITLESFIESGEQLPISETIQIFIEIADALAHAHRAGIIHRDIKPGNIMLVKTDDGLFTPIVLDFGIAKFDTASDAEQRLTEAGAMIGSPLYMSPEQCKGETAGAASDQYSLGCVLFECLAGEPPFRGDTAYDTAVLHISGQCPDPIAASRTPISQKLGNTIVKMLAKKPEERFANTDELLTSLIELRDDTIVEALDKPGNETDGVGKTISIPAIWLAFGLALLALGGFGLVEMIMKQPVTEETPKATYSAEVVPFQDNFTLSKSRRIELKLVPITPGILRQLSDRNDLTRVELTNVPAQDDTLKALEPSKNTLNELLLRGTAVKTLEHLPPLKNITWLVLSNTDIDDDALKNVVALRRLHILEIESCNKLTNASLKTFEKFPVIRSINLGKTKFRKEEIERLQERMPFTKFPPFLPTAPLTELRELAFSLYTSGNFEESLKVYDKAVKRLCQARGHNSPQAAELLLEAATAAIAWKRESRAKGYIEHADRCAIESREPSIRAKVLGARVNLIGTFTKDRQKQIDLLRERIKLIKNAAQENTRFGRDQMFSSGFTLLQLQQVDESAKLLEQCRAYDLSEYEHSDQDKAHAYLRYGDDLNALGLLALQKQQFAKAEKYLAEALKIANENRSSKLPSHFAELNFWLALAINGQGRPHEALKHSEIAAAIAKQNNHPLTSVFEKYLEDIRKTAETLAGDGETQTKDTSEAKPAD